MNKTTDSSRGTGRQIAALAAGRWGQLVLTFVMPLFLVRFLSRADYGLYSQFYAVALFLANIFACAFPSGIYYFYPRIEISERRAMLGNIAVAMLTGAAICSALLAFTPAGNWILGDNGLMKYAGLIAVFLFFYMPATIIDPFYVVRRDTLTALLYPAGIQLLKTAAVIIFSCWGGALFYTFMGVLTAQIIISGFVCFYCWYNTSECAGAAFLSASLFKQQLKYTAPFAVSGILGTVSHQLDKLICISFMTPDEYALYAVAFFGIPGIQQIYSSVSNVYLVEMSACFHANRPKEALEILKKLESKVISFSLPVILTVFIFADEIIGILFTEKYLDSTGYFRLYIFIFTFEVVASGLIARASGNTHLNLITGVASACITIPFTYFAVKYYGAWGGIAGVMLSALGQRLMYMWFEMRIVQTSLLEYLPWKKLGMIFAVSFIGAIPLWLIDRLWHCNIWLGGILSVLYLTGVYAVEIRRNIFIVEREYIRRQLVKYKLGFIAEKI